MRLAYNCENNHYGILNNANSWERKGLRSGEWVEVYHNGKWITDRMELKFPKTWYLLETKLSGNRLEGLEVRIK